MWRQVVRRSSAVNMAWTSHGRDNAELITALQQNGLITSNRVAEVCTLLLYRASSCRPTTSVLGYEEGRPQKLRQIQAGFLP